MATKEQIAAHVAELRANPAALEPVMMRVFMNDTEQIKAAEEILKQYTKKPASVPVLLGIMKTSTQPQVRQLAAVLLKKKIVAHWPKFTAQQGSEIKATLLEAVVQEPVKLVRHAVATLMARLSKQLFADQQTGWPEMLHFVAQCAQQKESEDHRELAFVILHELTETIGDVLESHFGTLKSLFLQALQDPSPRVQVGALQASSRLLVYLSSEKSVLTFQDLIPPSLAVAQACAARGDEESVRSVLEVFTDLSMCPVPVLKPYMGPIVDFLLAVLRNSELEMNTRDVASLVISNFGEVKSKDLVKTNKIPAILSVMVELIAAHTGSAANALFTYDALSGDGDDDDNDGPTTQSIAQTTLDTLALNVPTKYIFPPSADLCGQCFVHPNAHMRKAGVALMGVITEGCKEAVRTNLDQIVPRILTAAVDTEPLVRECACFCLGQLSEHCQPDILDYHAEILPVVFQLLDDATDNVKGVSCYVLEMFCENLQPATVLPFLPQLMNRLVQMLQTPKRAVQEMSVAAIAATAVAAETAFTPYLAHTATLMSQMLLITDETMLSLRGRALECMGHMAIAVEADAFQPYVDMCMHSASEGLKIDNVELHEFAYTFFANLAKVMKIKMAPYLPVLVPHLLAEINESDSEDPQALAQTMAASIKADGATDDEADEDYDSDADSEESYDQQYMNVHTAALDKKKAALLVLGALAQFAPTAFESYLQPVLECLKVNAESWHSEIRSEVCDALKAMVDVSAACYPPERHWTAGQAVPLHPHTASLTSAVVLMLLTIMKDDHDPEVVAKACEALQGVFSLVGPMALTPHLNDVMQLTAVLLADKAECQTFMNGVDDDDDDESPEVQELSDGEDEEADSDDHDNDLNEAVADLVGGLARVIGPNFGPFFDTFLPLLLAKCSSKKSPAERQMAMGAMAEVLQAMGSAGGKYVPAMLPAVRKGLKDSDSRIVRNTCFCAGVMAECAGAAFAPHVMDILQLLAPIFQRTGKGSSEGGLLDNAAAAVARIVMACPNSVPMAQVLPALLSALPLKVDDQEHETVYTCVVGLLTMRHPVALTSLPSILTVLAQALAEDSKVDDDVKSKIVAGLTDRILVASIGPQIAAALEQVPPEHRELLRAKLAAAQ